MNNTIAICESIIQQFDQRMSDTYDLPSALNEIIARLSAAEARAAQAEQDRDDYGRKYSALMQASGAKILTLKAEITDLRAHLEQAQRDLSYYRAEIERLTRKVMTIPTGDGVYRP